MSQTPHFHPIRSSYTTSVLASLFPLIFSASIFSVEVIVLYYYQRSIPAGTTAVQTNSSSRYYWLLHCCLYFRVAVENGLHPPAVFLLQRLSFFSKTTGTMSQSGCLIQGTFADGAFRLRQVDPVAHVLARELTGAWDGESTCRR